MSYAIIRNENYKKDNLAGLYKHNERKNTNYSNKDIAKEKSKYNYSIKKCNTTYTKALNQVIEKYDLKCRITSYTNLVCEFVITSSKEFFEQIGEKETERYFQTAYNFVAQYKNLGEQYILSATVHNDETTPHMHIDFVPVVPEFDKKSGKKINKIACSKYWKGKNSYRQLQDDFHKYITDNGFNLERGKEHEIEHLSTEKLKQVTNYDNIKYEINNEKITPLETKNTALIVQQNKELIEYTNKLKLQLTKSLNAIQYTNELYQENINLRQENKKLKDKNNTLLKYIHKIFKVVYLVFDLPKEAFKLMIDSFSNRNNIDK